MMNLNFSCGWVGGWLDQMELRLNSASVEVEVEVEVEAELGNNFLNMCLLVAAIGTNLEI